MEIHKPVLLKEVLELLNPKEGETYFDGTINGGGHAAAILERIGAGGRIIGFDWDCDLVDRLRIQYPKEKYPNIELECANYADAKEVFDKRGWGNVNSILLDLGFSSYHVEHSGRGFSFRRDETLDMRYHKEKEGVRAYDIINSWTTEKLEHIFREYGEERFARQIADAIVATRAKNPIQSTAQLAVIIEKSIPSKFKKSNIHPATRVFQALRIAVNHEFENIEKFLQIAPDLLYTGGKIAIISFHSLEDRIIKNAFKDFEKKGILTMINKKVVQATFQEKQINSRARSAKLRVAQKP